MESCAWQPVTDAALAAVLTCALQAIPGITLLVWAPLNLLPLLLSSQPAAQYLSGLCLASAVAQFFSMRHQKHIGSKVV